MGLKKRPLHVKQKETDAGQYWYTIDRGNGSTMANSETYTTRDGALRAARNFIEAIDPVPVVFTYWVGPRPPFASDDVWPGTVTERLRGA